MVSTGGLPHNGVQSWVTAAHKNQWSDFQKFCKPFHKLSAWNQSWGKYLHHRNWQMVQIKSLSTSAEPVFNIYQHFSGQSLFVQLSIVSLIVSGTEYVLSKCLLVELMMKGWVNEGVSFFSVLISCNWLKAGRGITWDCLSKDDSSWEKLEVLSSCRQVDLNLNPSSVIRCEL